MAEDKEIVRQNAGDIDPTEKDKRIGALKASRDFTFKSFLPVTDNCHFERYNFLCGKDRLNIVYDTKAKMLTFTALSDVLDKAEKAVSQYKNKSGAVRNTAKSRDSKNAKHEKREDAVKSADSAQDAPEYKNGFAVKKCPPERMEGIVRRIQALKGVTVKSQTSAGDVVTYAVTDKLRQQKCLLRYFPKKHSAQLQGKRSNLFGEVQVILSRDSGFNEAVGSHMELTGEQRRMGAVQRSLKKLLPDAFDLLSEQSKIDLGIGMIDIGNTEVTLSDYSVLLVPPYRGLERFIFDLQQAYGISVKMIGQAYEKDENGKHVLKACYRKKTGIVYSEVMSALYTEYFEKRNFYAHSDNSEFGNSRVISDKTAAKSIFDKLCAIVNYNSKKLKETNFSLSKERH